MPSCCYPEEYGDFFSGKDAAKRARRYQRRGLSGSQKTLAEGLKARGIEGATVLEVGGGVGALQVDLLRAGAAATTSIELAPGWEDEAAALLRTYQVTDRATRRLGDFVDEAAELPEADAVVLHRVVCCYPHWERMLDAAAGRATRNLAMTFPVDRLHNRGFLGLGNWMLQLRKRRFRAFVHPARGMLAALEKHGFAVVHDESGLIWRSVILERA